MANYLQLPPVIQALQWDGTNAAAIQAQVNNGNPDSYGAAFIVDASGNATVTIMHTTYPVPLGDWLVTDPSRNTTLRPMPDANFQAQYVAGSKWAVAP